MRGILQAVREEGDAALDRFSLDLDGHPVEEIPKKAWRQAYEDLDEELRDALETAKERIEAFYREEARGGFLKADEKGLLGQLVRPMARVGVYVPGGTAPLLSSLLMTVVPAKVAGVAEVIVADGSASPRLLAADLLAQAEHGPDSEPWLLSPERALLERVEAELAKQLSDLPRAEIARRALEKGGLVLTRDLEEALELANLYAPEHLCLALADPLPWLGRVQNAGGVFLGEGSPEALGDYIAGPSHVMPTSGTARFQGGLSVRDFLKVIPVMGLSEGAVKVLAQKGALLARAEGLEGHARSLDLRQ